MKNSNAFLWALSLLCSFAVSCRQGDGPEYALPKFEKEIAKEFEIVGPELDYGVCHIYSYADYLILDAHDMRTNQFLHIWDKKTGEIIHSTAREGRGPGELLFRPVVSRVGHECYLYDRQQDVTQVYDLDKVLQGENGYLWTLLETVNTFTIGVYHGPGDRALIFSNDTFLQLDSSRTVTRIVLEKDAERYAYNEYPVPDRERTWAMYMTTPFLTISPDFTKMVIAPAYGGILERFDLSDGISLLGVDKFVEPDFDVKGGMADFSAERPLPICFTGFAATNDRFFAAMDEKGAWWIGGNDSREGHMTVVGIFDWEGHPLMRIKNSRHIESLAYDEEEGVLYAVLSDAENVLHIGRMDLGDLPL